jgi:hypothetical protein
VPLGLPCPYRRVKSGPVTVTRGPSEFPKGPGDDALHQSDLRNTSTSARDLVRRIGGNELTSSHR